MNPGSANKLLRTTYPKHLTAFIALLALAVMLLAFGCFYMPDSGFELENGTLDLTGYRRYDDRVIYLDGEWEYYPGRLIVSEPVEGPLPAELVNLPMRALSGGIKMPENGKASFRIVLTNIQEDHILTLSIPAYYGSYRIYVDGVLCEDPIERLTPNFFQFTSIWGTEGSTRELVLEIDQPSFYGFDKCPVISDTDLQFNTYFADRIMFLVFFGMLLFAFVILPFLYQFYQDSYLRYFAVSGCIGLIAFLMETLWYYGIIGYVEKLVAPQMLFCVRVLTELLLFISICYAQAKQCKGPFPDRGRRWFAVAAAALAVLTLGALLCLSRQNALLVFYLCAGATGIAAMVFAVAGIRETGSRALIPAVGSLSLFAGFLFNDVSVFAEAMLGYQAILPACLLITLICWSLMISASHKSQIALIQKALSAEQVTARTQAAFLASQIQPHFLYNTLTTIQELCYTDPLQAAETVVRFSNYLRQNIDFMEYKDKIPFSVEMEHIENYLDIQRARFGDAIRFVKNITFEQFELPPLTVQPLVENAVSHGIRRHNGQGTVTLDVRRIDRDIVISVADDGEGFDVDAVHSRSLENIRCRIEGAMGGTVHIDSAPGKGTTVILRFPYKEAVIHENRDR